MAEQLQKNGTKGYAELTLRLCRQFYLSYPGLPGAPICSAVRNKLAGSKKSAGNLYAVRGHLPSTVLVPQIIEAARTAEWQPGQLHPGLSWTHYRALMRVSNLQARAFYEIEAIQQNWMARELERQINYGKIRQLYELLEPDDFLMPHRADYVWLSKLYMVYRKKFYPLDKYETATEDGAKTRDLIREHLDVDKIKKEFPTYVLDENYLTKLDDIDPDSKALDIEAMLAAELKIRVDEDPQAEALSEKLKRIIDTKRNEALQGVALISALEKLAGEVVDLINEGKKPVAESIAHAAREINPGLTDEQAAAIAAAVVAEAGKVCFPNWHLKSDMKSNLFLGITTVLVQQFKDANLHMPASGFTDRAMRLLEKTRFVGKADEDSAS